MTRDLDRFATEYFAVRLGLRDPASRDERIADLRRPPNASQQLMDLVIDQPTEAWRLTLGLIERAESEKPLPSSRLGRSRI
jgi:hypothetical protein